MDAAIDGQFGPDQFVTAQMMRLDIATGHLQWVNAGHPAPLLIRDRRVVRPLESPTTLPVGFGGATPQISEQVLRRGDRVLFFTDGAIEEHKPGGEQFGQQRLIEFVERAGPVGEGVQEMVRSLSHSLVWGYVQLTVASDSGSQGNKCSRGPCEVVAVPERQPAGLGRYRCRG